MLVEFNWVVELISFGNKFLMVFSVGSGLFLGWVV